MGVVAEKNAQMLSHRLEISEVLWGFVGYGQPLWLPHTGQAQGQPLHLVSTP